MDLRRILQLVVLLEFAEAEQPPRLLRASYGAADSPDVVACSRQMQIH